MVHYYTVLVLKRECHMAMNLWDALVWWWPSLRHRQVAAIRWPDSLCRIHQWDEVCRVSSPVTLFLASADLSAENLGTGRDRCSDDEAGVPAG